jgi:hypothetical protein
MHTDHQKPHITATASLPAATTASDATTPTFPYSLTQPVVEEHVGAVPAVQDAGECNAARCTPFYCSCWPSNLCTATNSCRPSPNAPPVPGDPVPVPSTRPAASLRMEAFAQVAPGREGGRNVQQVP